MDLTTWVLRRLSINTIDRFKDGEYRRAFVVGGQVAEISVSQPDSFGNGRLSIRLTAERLSPSLKKTTYAVVDRLLGLDVDLTRFYRIAENDAKLGVLIERFKGVKPPRFPTVFEALVNAFACQQVSLNVGLRILNRLTENYGESLDLGRSEKLHAFPTPDRLASLNIQALRMLGLSNRKSEYIVETSKLISREKLELESIAEMGDEEAIEFLMQIRGVGRWTAEYVLLRGDGRLHIFPGDDAGAQNGLRRWLRIRRKLDYDGVREVVSQWQPYSGMLYFHLLLSKIEQTGYLGRGECWKARDSH